MNWDFREHVTCLMSHSKEIVVLGSKPSITFKFCNYFRNWEGFLFVKLAVIVCNYMAHLICFPVLRITVCVVCRPVFRIIYYWILTRCLVVSGAYEGQGQRSNLVPFILSGWKLKSSQTWFLRIIKSLETNILIKNTTYQIKNIKEK